MQTNIVRQINKAILEEAMTGKVMVKFPSGERIFHAKTKNKILLVKLGDGKYYHCDHVNIIPSGEKTREQLLKELEARKLKASQEIDKNIQGGEIIFLSLTAYEEAKIKQLKEEQK